MIWLFLKVVYRTVWLIQVDSNLWIILWISIWPLVEIPCNLLFFISISILHCELILLYLKLIHPLKPFLRFSSDEPEQILIFKNLSILKHCLCFEQPLQKIAFLMQEIRDRLLRIFLNPMWLLEGFRDLKLEFALQYLFLFTDLIDYESLVIKLNDIKTPLILILWDC